MNDLPAPPKYYFAIDGVTLPNSEPVGLGLGITIRKAVGKLVMAPLIHIGGEQYGTAQGSKDFETFVELSAPKTPSPVRKITDPGWLAILLLRFYIPAVQARFCSSIPIDQLKARYNEAQVRMVEVETGYLVPIATEDVELDSSLLGTISELLPKLVELVSKSPKFAAAFQAYDHAPNSATSVGAMLYIWGALELLFVKDKTETNHRLALNLASHLYEPGDTRYEVFRRIKKLYGFRSSATHELKSVELDHVKESLAFLRVALLLMMQRCEGPDKLDFDKNLLSGK